MSESEFRSYFRGLLRKNGVWTASIEHRSGGSVGLGDVLVQCGEFLIPVELKVGKWRRATNKLHSSRIRPAQIKFMDEAQSAGIAVRLVIGVAVMTSDGASWQGWMLRDVRRERLIHWRLGFAESDLVRIVARDKLLIPVVQW